ncbi:MAG TPA: inositol monophosphatase family protein [Anaerolineaceae bacterium]
MAPTLFELKSWALQAGEILRAGVGQEHFIHHKGTVNLVTEMDQRSEDFLVKEIRQHYPDHRIVTEESGLLEGLDTNCWYIDPLDGTTNYAHGLPIFSVSIGYAEHGQMKLGVVYDPMQDEMFCAEQGGGAWLDDQPLHVSVISELLQSLLVTGFPYDLLDTPQNNLENFTLLSRMSQGVRRLGSAALDLCYVAAGRLDGYWEVRLSPWDLAAGALMVREAGGVVTSLSGSPDLLQPPYSIVAGNPYLQPELLKLLK